MNVSLLRAAGGLLPALVLVAVPVGPGHRVALPANGMIEGRVRDGAGAPIANAQVSVVGTSHAGLSDRLGRYRIASVPAGTHALRASAIGFRAEEASGVRVSDGATTFQDFTLKAGPERPDAVTTAAWSGRGRTWRVSSDPSNMASCEASRLVAFSTNTPSINSQARFS